MTADNNIQLTSADIYFPSQPNRAKYRFLELPQEVSILFEDQLKRSSPQRSVKPGKNIHTHPPEDKT